MTRTRIKICGITRPEDAAEAAELGADFLGFNLLAGPRRIHDRQVSQILFDAAKTRRMTRDITCVALCAMPGASFPGAMTWSDITGSLLKIRQIYGDDYAPLASAKPLALDWWMVRQVPSRVSLVDIAAECHMLEFKPSALLLDTASVLAGGTGKTFNWHWIAEARAAGELDGLPPIILAGGLNPDNVAEAIRIARPYAVDVSSGVEVPGKPGIKDPLKLRDFIQAAHGA